MFWIIAILIIVILLIWLFYLKPYKYWKNQGIPQARPWFLIGDIWPTLFQVNNLLEWMDWIYELHPKSKYVGIYQFLKPLLYLKDPELIKQLTVKDFDNFTDHNNFGGTEETDPLWSKNLFALKGKRWRDMRSLLSGSFTSSKMRVMYTLISEESQKFVNHFLKKKEDFLELEFKDVLTRYTNDVIASTSFGIKVDSLENPENEFFKMGKEASNFSGFVVLLKFIGLMFFPWLFKLLNIGFISKRVTKFFTSMINETIKVREENNIVRPDMINLLLEVRKGLNKEEKDVTDSGFAVVQESQDLVKANKKQIRITNMDIASQAMIFFLAGFDSVSTAMCYTCYELAINPRVQDKLRSEITDVFETTNGQPSYENILEMKYLDMVISETLRKWPPSPATDRVCVKPYTLQPKDPNDVVINFKKGDIIWIPIYNIHHDSKYYPEPKKFMPERFTKINKEKINPYTYMPFGVGPRACIGSRFALLEIKLILFHLLHKFEIVPTKETRIPLKISKTAINLMPEGKFPLGLKRI